MENDLAQLSINDEKEEIIHIPIDPNKENRGEIFQLVGCFLIASTIHFPAMKSTMANYGIRLREYESVIWEKKGNFLGNFLEHDVSVLGKGNRNYMRIRVQIDIRRLLKRRKKMSFGGKCSYVNFKYERLSLFYFYCGRLGHNDSFCKERMNLGVETAEMGWDLSIRAQSRRSLAINSIWLQEEGDRDNRGIDAEFRNFRKEQKTPGWKIRYGENVDPVLGFTLAGGSLHVERGKENLTPNAMDQDPEEVALVGEEGKKRPRGETDDTIGKE
ncbi:hypothetical protein Gotur_032280 [Gossypium turneri]